MKKFIIFLLPILFLFSCTKPYGDEPYLDGPSLEEIFKGKWEYVHDKDNITYTFTINTIDGVRTFTRKGLNVNRTWTDTLKNLSFKSNELTYFLGDKKYTHEAEMKKPDYKLEIDLKPGEYGAFAVFFENVPGYTVTSSKSFRMRKK